MSITTSSSSAACSKRPWSLSSEARRSRILASSSGIGRALLDQPLGAGERRLGAGEVEGDAAGVAEIGPGAGLEVLHHGAAVALAVEQPGEQQPALGQLDGPRGVAEPLLEALLDQQLADGEGRRRRSRRRSTDRSSQGRSHSSASRAGAWPLRRGLDEPAARARRTGGPRRRPGSRRVVQVAPEREPARARERARTGSSSTYRWHERTPNADGPRSSAPRSAAVSPRETSRTRSGPGDPHSSDLLRKLRRGGTGLRRSRPKGEIRPYL